MARTPSAVLTETKPSRAVKKAEKLKVAKAELKSAEKDLTKAQKTFDKAQAKVTKLEGSTETIVEEERPTVPLIVEAQAVAA